MFTSWWPFRKGESSSPPADFLYLSKANIGETIDLIKRCGEPLNPHQCRSLSFKLDETIKNIESAVAFRAAFHLLRCSPALENFYRISEKAKQLVEKCCSENWCREAAFQIQNEEAFKEILLETSLCYNTIRAIVENLNGNKTKLFSVDLRNSPTFEPPPLHELLIDRSALTERLNGLVNNSSADSRSRHLGQYLLGRLSCVLQQSIDEDFDVRKFILWQDGEGPDGEWSEKSEVLGGNVCKTSWLDVPCAKKLFQDELLEDEWLAEAKILASLSHPNIVKFLCCNKYETTHSSGHFIAMEQMETNLGSYIRRLMKEKSRLSILPALDVILQIAHGMCYLHDNGVAHRDLKPVNVVVCSTNGLHLQYKLQVKVVDFGLSKVKLSASKSNTITRLKIGTTLYMPPEAFRYGRANWFKADVYSFSVMCSLILSGNEPFEGIKRNDFYETICRGERPKLPADIPRELVSLITEGWATNRDLRPSFVDICTRLEKIRCWLLEYQTLPVFWNHSRNENANLYVEEIVKRRSEARHQQRSPVSDENEWFDGDECEVEAGADNDKLPVIESNATSGSEVCRANPREPMPISSVADDLQMVSLNGLEQSDEGPGLTGGSPGRSRLRPLHRSIAKGRQKDTGRSAEINLQRATRVIKPVSYRATKTQFRHSEMDSGLDLEMRLGTRHATPIINLEGLRAEMDSEFDLSLM